MKIILKIKTALYACIIAAGVLSIPAASAQENTSASPVDILPAKTLKNETQTYSQSNDTHPPLKLTPDKSELVRLDKDAGSIIIGSPSHLSVLADSAKTLVLVPQIPGATYVTVLDKKGNVLMQRHVIVASPKEKYVRIRKSCGADQEGCQNTQVYYCPDMCHKVNVPQEATAAQDTAEEGSVQVDNINITPPDNSDTEGN